jgi:aspartyl/asparaginyl beta-hydroxylase (cupin superfamily)
MIEGQKVCDERVDWTFNESYVMTEAISKYFPSDNTMEIPCLFCKVEPGDEVNQGWTTMTIYALELKLEEEHAESSDNDN